MKNSRTDTTYSIFRKKLFKPLLVPLAAALILPLVSAIALPGTAQAMPIAGQTDWIKSASPVLLRGTAGAWDENSAGNVSVVKDGNTFKMYYSGQNAAGYFQIGLATSSDGVNWTKNPGNPVLTNGAANQWDSVGVASPAVIKDGSVFRMWFMGRDAGNVTRIGYATSTDGGLTWTKHAANPVLSPQHPFEVSGVGSPSVIKEGSGTLRMWYTAKVGPADFAIGELTVGLATSTDGVAWTKNGNAPVFGPGAAGSFDERGVGVASVMLDQGLYKMWYTGYRDMGLAATNSKIGFAYSTDGILWPNANRSNVPVINTGAVTAWDGRAVGSPSVIRDSGVFKMWFSGLDSNLAAATGFARIPDLRIVHAAREVGDPTTEIISVKHSVTSVLSDGAPFSPSGGIAAYSASATYSSTGMNILAVTGIAPFAAPTVTLNTPPGSTTYSIAPLPGGGPQAPFDMALITPRLVGAATNRYDLTLDLNAATGDAKPVAQQASAVIPNVMRGDAAKNVNNFTASDLAVNMTDALFIAQFRVSIRDVDWATNGFSTINPLAAASVRYDGAAGDRINIQDAMFIAQMRVGIRDTSYVLLP